MHSGLIRGAVVTPFTVPLCATMIAPHPSGVVIMGRFPFFVLVERHRVVAPTSARPWAAAVPAL